MQADIEEQQHDSNLGKLTRDLPIGLETGCRRTNNNTRNQETDDRGDAKQ
jgi:hypothetical protein